MSAAIMPSRPARIHQVMRHPAEAADGVLEAVGAGATVILSLPRGSVAPAAVARDAAAALAGDRDLQVLVVDDDAGVRSMTAAMLREMGCTVEEADSGAAALQRLAEGPPVEVLVADYAVPGITGAELLQRTRALRPGLRGLLVTGYVAEPGLERLAPVLGKPFDSGGLRQALALLAARPAPSQTGS
jgi:CheY-like chemotaxis protein